MKKAFVLASLLIIFSLLSTFSSPVFIETVASKTEPNSINGGYVQVARSNGNVTLKPTRAQSGTSIPFQLGSLSVPYHFQVTNYYCGEAALEMIFNYYGADISQYQIADVARAQSGLGTYTDDMRRAGHFSNLSTSVGNDAPGYSCTGYAGRKLGYGAFEYWFTDQTSRLSQLRALINQGYPVEVLTWYDSNHSNGHFRVVIGYDSDGIFAQDPWDGPSQYYNNSLFMDLWSYSDYWGMYTGPWSVSINSPSYVVLNSTFQVSANITYSCPNPFGINGDYPATSSNVAIQLPSGLSLASGQTATKPIANLFACKDSVVVSWNVTSNTSGSYQFSIEAAGLIQGSVGSHGPYPSYQYEDRIGGVQNGTITVKTLHLVTFTQSGLSSDTSGTVLVLNSTAKGYADLPFRIWILDGEQLSYSYSTAVTSTMPGKRLVLGNVTGPLSPTIVTTDLVISGNFNTQYSVTFVQSGLDSTVTGTVVTVDGNPEVFGVFPYTLWVDSGSVVTYSYRNPVSSSVSGKQFRLTTLSIPASPINITSATTVADNYITQYSVIFAQTGISSDASGTIVNVNSSMEAYSNLPYISWVDNGSSVTYSYNSLVASTISGRQYRLDTIVGPTSPITATSPAAVTGNFTVDLAPTIIVVSPQNRTYSTDNVSLTFMVDKLTSWTGYSIDNQRNTTIAGNTTITNLLDGNHYLIVFCNSTTGNMGRSGIVHFTIDTIPPNITNVSQIPQCTNVTATDIVRVNATVTDAASNVQRVILNYTTDDSTYLAVNMTSLGEDVYAASIPMQPLGTNVTYTIMAEDSANNTMTTQKMGFTYQYRVISEFPPLFVLPSLILATLLAAILYRRKARTSNLKAQVTRKKSFSDLSQS